jgi:hypothetical protein
MVARILSLILPVIALLAIGSASAAPDLMMKWQSRSWTSLIEGQRHDATPEARSAPIQQVAILHPR